MTKQLYSIKDIKKELGLCHTKVYGLIKEGKLKTHKIGTRTVVKAESLRDFVDSLPEVNA